MSVAGDSSHCCCDLCYKCGVCQDLFMCTFLPMLIFRPGIFLRFFALNFLPQLIPTPRPLFHKLPGWEGVAENKLRRRLNLDEAKPAY